MITAQFCVNGNAKQADIVRAFGVTKISLKRAVKRHREEGPKGFYKPRKRRGPAILTPTVLAEAQKLLHQLRISGVAPADKVSELKVGKQQMVEIAKALSKNARILVFDEPTSALTDKEVDALFATIRQLKDAGVCMSYISHKMDELEMIVDRVAVLRDGKTIGDVTPIGQITMDEIISRMVGRDIKDMFPKIEGCQQEKVLEVNNLDLEHPSLPGKRLIKNVSFCAYSGEILGISGLMGSGRSELVSSIFGVYRNGMSGKVLLKGKPLKIKHPRDAIRNGIPGMFNF